MQTALDVGADVASKTVVVACAAGTFAPRTIDNEWVTLRAWLQTLPGREPTGAGVHGELSPAAGGSRTWRRG